MIDLAAALVEQGHDATLLTYSDPSVDHFTEPPGVKRVGLRLLWESTGPLDTLVSNMKRVRMMRAAIRQAGADVIVSFIDLTNVLTLVAALGLGIPVVISERIHPDHHEIGRRWRILRRIVYPLCDALVVQTEAIATWARGLVRQNAVRIIPNAMPRRRWPASTTRENMIVGVGRLHRQKGFDLLIEAFARSDLPSDWTLVLVGDGPERRVLLELIRTRGLEERVQFTGEVPDPENWLARASIFVLSSRYEGFPNVLLEAIGCATPAIAFDCPTGPREILAHGGGVLVEHMNVAALASTLTRLASAPAERAALAASSVKVVQAFSQERINRLWFDLLDRLVSPQPRRRVTAPR